MRRRFNEESISRSQLDVIKTLCRLWIEHVLWTRFFIVSATFGLPDLDAVTKRLLQNPTDFARVLRPLYGNMKAKEFERLFTDHLLIAAALVNAAKAGNTAEVETQRAKWYRNAEEIAAFLASINPFWSKSSWRSMLFEHLRMTENEAVQMLTGQYAESIAQYDAIQRQALMMADEMSQGIIRQFKI